MQKTSNFSPRAPLIVLVATYYYIDYIFLPVFYHKTAYPNHFFLNFVLTKL